MEKAKWFVDPELIAKAELMPPVAKQLIDDVRRRLATGQFVTVSFNGKPLTTYWPDGHVEHHDDMY